ncbi:MAG: TonB-dependent receptor domain-containing protein [Runella sp.]
MTLRFIVFLLIWANCCYALNLRGTILDAKTKEALIGATVYVKETGKGTTTDLDGSFLLKDLPSGRILTFEVSYIGYNTRTVTHTPSSEPLVILLEENQRLLTEVVVKGSYQVETDESARSLERRADNVLNVVAAKAIQISPDVTVANVIQRVSGISIERNSNGDGQHAIVRGMDKRYNYTLVNGVKIPSPDNRYRYVPLDIFPADLLDRLEVVKSLTPDLEGDAIGGAINLVMKNAPQQAYFAANIATGFSELFTQQDYARYPYRGIVFRSPYEINGNGYNATLSDFNFNRLNIKNQTPPPNLVGSLAWGRRFLRDKLGVLAAASYQNTFRGVNSLFFEAQNVDTDRTSTITKMNERQFSEQQTRYGIHLKADWQLSPQHRLEWYNAFLNLDNIQTRDTKITEFSFGYFPEMGNYNLAFNKRLRLTRQQILNSTLKGEHALGRLLFKWAGAYSLATNAIPDNTSLQLLGNSQNFVERITYPNSLNRRWEHNSDQDLALYLNFILPVQIAQTRLELSGGGLYRDKTRNNFYNNYAFAPSNPFDVYGVNYQGFTDIRWRLINPRGAVATALSYDATERIGAAYGQFKFTKWNTQFVGGLRVEHTDQGYSMLFPIGEDRPVGSQIYTDFLPSLQAKFMPRDRVNVRFSYFRSINRPGFFEIVPYRIINEEFTERGNPDLRRAIADNLDLRYEFFPRPSEQIMVGLFYKFIKDPIEYTLQADANRGQSILYTPGNFGNAQNYGLELDFIKYIGKWGLKANYTFTNSNITTLKTIRIRDTNGDLRTVQQNQTRPLYGQSRHIYNATLLYKNTAKTLDAQLAASYTGKRIFTVSQFLDNDLWQQGFVQVDASLEKGFGKKWVVFAKANNLLNTPLQVYIQNVNPKNEGLPYQENSLQQTLVRRDYYQRAYLFGLRFKL